MKRKSLLFAILILVCAVFAGCAAEENASEPVFQTPAPTETATPAPTAEPTPEPTPEPGDFGESLKGELAKVGSETVRAKKYYCSEDVRITMNDYREDGLAYYVADIYIRNIENFRTAFSGGKFHSKSVRTDVQARANDALVAISGDFYNFVKKGLVIRNGEVYRTELSDWDVCVLFRDGTVKTYSPAEAEEQLDSILASDPWQSWCFGPRLLEDGKPMTEFNTSVSRANPRSVFGYYEPGHYCFVTVDGRQGNYSRGLDMAGLSELMYRLGCKEAFNLDGGKTATMALYGEVYNRIIEDGRGVSDILYIGETEEGQ